MVKTAPQAEHYFTSDPPGALMKLRRFGELLAERAAAYLGVSNLRAGGRKLSQHDLVDKLDAYDALSPEVMALLRTALRGRGGIERERVIRAIGEGLGYQRVSAKLRKRLDGHLRAAVRRKVIEGGGGEELRLATRRVEDYSRDELVASLRSVSRRGCVYPREELARAVLDHLGFRRLTKGAKAALKSAFNAAIRREVFERVDAELVRRV